VRYDLGETGRILIIVSGVLIAFGGLYDLLAPRLPLNLALICAGNRNAEKLVRELLRALGGALFAIGMTIALLAVLCGYPISHTVLIVVFVLVVPAEGTNAVGMYRVGSPYQIPLSFSALTILGVILSWSSKIH
jgi:hypothetical protein